MIAAGKVTAGLAETVEVYTAEFVPSVTCRLTAQDWGQLRSPYIRLYRVLDYLLSRVSESMDNTDDFNSPVRSRTEQPVR